MILQCIALQQKIRQARWVVCLFACICCSLAPAQKQADLEALVADFHEVRNEFDRAARNDAEIPLELTRRVQEVTNAIGREGPAGQNFLFGRLTLDTGAMQGHLVEGLLASHEPRVSQRIYKQAQLTERRQAPLGREAFQTFFELVPTNHLTIQFADLGRFVNSNPSWRRNGVMSYLARVQTLESIHYLLECPLVDKRDGEYSENAVFATLGHFRSLLQELEDPKAVAAVATALTGKPRYFAKGASAFDPKTQTEATLALGELGYIDVAPVMARNLGHKHLELAVASARALGSLRVAAAYEPLEKALGARKSAEFSLVALYALSRIDAVRTKPLLLAHAKSKDWRIRSVVVQGLGLAQDPATDALLLEFLTDASWQVRKSAFEALAARPTREFIGALIASLAQQRGALRSRIYKALTIWTERNLGPDPKAWEDFWKAEGEKFSLVDRPVPVGRTYVDHGDPSLPRYFGMEIHSQDVAFVIDRSGSMRLRYLAPGEDGGSKSMQGLQMVKKELWKTLEKLKEAQRFNIVAFGTSFKPLFRQPKKASGRGKRAAAGFLDKLYAEGGTNIFDPLDRLIRDGKVETIYVLSDGEPTLGRYVAPEVIRRELQRLNVYSHVTIHTFALGRSSEFLEKLAAENNGEYRRVDVPAVTAAVPGAPAHRNDPRRGHFETTFEERSPLSVIKQQVSRDRYNGKHHKPDDYDVTKQGWRVFVPEYYDAQEEYGLLVWIDPSEQGRIPYPEALTDRKLIGISPNGAGNTQSMWVRAGLALDAAHNMSKRFMIDSKRIYVAGFSGGGRMSSRLGVMYADVFSGAFAIDGTDWWEDIPADESPGKFFAGRYQKPKGAILKKARRVNRYLLMTGENDANRPGTKAAYRHGFKKAGFKHVKYVEVRGKGHEWPSQAGFLAGLRFLDKG